MRKALIEFTSHGESTQGPDTSAVYTNGSFELKTDKAGTLLASAYGKTARN